MVIQEDLQTPAPDGSVNPLNAIFSVLAGALLKVPVKDGHQLNKGAHDAFLILGESQNGFFARLQIAYRANEEASMARLYALYSANTPK